MENTVEEVLAGNKRPVLDRGPCGSAVQTEVGKYAKCRMFWTILQEQVARELGLSLGAVKRQRGESTSRKGLKATRKAEPEVAWMAIKVAIGKAWR